MYDAQRKRSGVVEDVVADEQAAIFEGVVVHTLPAALRRIWDRISRNR